MDYRIYYRTLLGFAVILSLMLTVFKLIGVIDWTWIWVVSPIWILWIVATVIILVTLIIIGDANRNFKDFM